MSKISRGDLKKLAKLRLAEAEALHGARLFDGCVYLAGYAIELALKARICKLLELSEYPPKLKNNKSFISHDLEELRVLAGLGNKINIATNKELYDNWSKAVDWNSELRYESPGKYSQKSAKEILDSIRQKPNGVLTWLIRQW